MYRSVVQADRTTGRAHRIDDPYLSVGRRRRWHAVNRFLEERTVKRVGFVDDRQHLQGAAGEKPFDGVLGAWNELFDQHLAVHLVPFEPDIARIKQTPQPFEG